jgi:cardiolipin synthase
LTKDRNQYKNVLENTLGIPFTEKNSVEALVNGNEIFPAMLDAIEKSEEQIDFLTFVYWSGDIAVQFAKAFAKKADEGVKVRVILDSYGANFMPENLSKLMLNHGVELKWFRPLVRWKVWKTDNRTHRKVLICDKKVAFTGGVGIAEEWEGDARDPSEWRETHFKVKGEAVSGLQAAFMENWIETMGFLPIDPDWENDHVDGSDDVGNSLIQCLRTSASVRWSDIIMLYQTLIRIAQENIHITTAYFNPNDNIIRLLIEAVDRGVDVHILMPGKHTDKGIARLAGENAFETLLEGGVNLWYYQKTMLHSKVITIDGNVSCIGSANFNHRSMLKDDEVNLVIIDENLATTLNGHFQKDLEGSEKIDENRWNGRAQWRKSLEKLTNVIKQQI